MQKTLGEKASAARSQPYYLDVTHPQANKGTVVRPLSRLLNIPPAQIATIGDMPNDVLMFRKSGFSIAMGNASDEVKAQASAVTDSNENEGFANAAEKSVAGAGVVRMTGARRSGKAAGTSARVTKEWMMGIDPKSSARVVGGPHA